MPARNKRDLERLLRVLAITRAGVATEAAGPDRLRLYTARGQFVFARPIVQEALQRVLAVCNGGKLRITPDGHALTRRKDNGGDLSEFVAQHAVLTTATVQDGQGCRQEISVNANESPLARLFARKNKNGRPYLSESQFAAGERLRRDFERARLQRGTTMRWDGSVPGKPGMRVDGSDLSDMALDARRHVERAVSQLERSLREVALDVCCFLKGLEQVERERQWPPRSAKLMLRTALSILAVHYGFDAKANETQRPILHWGDGNHRPTITGEL